MNDKHNKSNDIHTQEAYAKTVEAFRGDKTRANEWMHQDNRFLKGESPMSLIGKGRAKELNKMIESLRPRKYY